MPEDTICMLHPPSEELHSQEEYDQWLALGARLFARIIPSGRHVTEDSSDNTRRDTELSVNFDPSISEPLRPTFDRMSIETPSPSPVKSFGATSAISRDRNESKVIGSMRERDMKHRSVFIEQRRFLLQFCEERKLLLDLMYRTRARLTSLCKRMNEMIHEIEVIKRSSDEQRMFHMRTIEILRFRLGKVSIETERLRRRREVYKITSCIICDIQSDFEELLHANVAINQSNIASTNGLVELTSLRGFRALRSGHPGSTNVGEFAKATRDSVTNRFRNTSRALGTSVRNLMREGITQERLPVIGSSDAAQAAEEGVEPRKFLISCGPTISPLVSKLCVNENLRRCQSAECPSEQLIKFLESLLRMLTKRSYD